MQREASWQRLDYDISRFEHKSKHISKEITSFSNIHWPNQVCCTNICRIIFWAMLHPHISREGSYWDAVHKTTRSSHTSFSTRFRIWWVELWAWPCVLQWKFDINKTTSRCMIDHNCWLLLTWQGTQPTVLVEILNANTPALKKTAWMGSCLKHSIVTACTNACCSHSLDTHTGYKFACMSLEVANG